MSSKAVPSHVEPVSEIVVRELKLKYKIKQLTIATIVLMVTVVASLESAIATTILVPADQPNIKDGIKVAQAGDTVLVAHGVYTGDDNLDINFGGKSIVVKSVNGPNSTIINCEGNSGNLHRAFIFNSNEDSTSVLEGFTIIGGWTTDGGGAIRCIGASPKIINNVLTECYSARDGGAIYCSGADPIIRDNVITGCDSGEDGGGIYCTESNPLIIHNVFQDNHANLDGGGLHSSGSNSQPYVKGNTFTANDAIRLSGKIFYFQIRR
jgi:hypothetical protein